MKKEPLNHLAPLRITFKRRQMGAGSSLKRGTWGGMREGEPLTISGQRRK